MGSDLRFNLINTFGAIDALRNNIVFNLQGAALPGFAQRRTRLALKSSLVELRGGQVADANVGGRSAVLGGPAELRVADSTFDFSQGKVAPADGKVTSLAISGDGFFAVAESLQPGARVMLTRDGSFSWKDTTPADKRASNFRQYHLTNNSGMFVLRAQDIDLDPNSPTFMKLKTAAPPPGMMVNSLDQRDGTADDVSGNNLQLGSWKPGRIRGVIGFTGDPFKMTAEEKALPQNNDSDIAIIRVPLKQYLQESSYGSTIYDTNLTTRAGMSGTSYAALKRAGDAVQVQSQSSENADAVTIEKEANIDSDVANFVFKNLRDMLDNYNRSLDDLLGLIR